MSELERAAPPGPPPAPGQGGEQVSWPLLPDGPWWRRYAAGAGEQCVFCAGQLRVQPGLVGRRPVWHRVGADGAVLVLCHAHADLFAPETCHK